MAKLVYQRKNGQWEARYRKGISKDGKTLYGTVYADTKEAAIAKRIALLGYDPDGPKLPTELNLLILGAGSHGRDVKEVAESLRIFKKISFLDDYVTGDGIIGKCSDAYLFKQGYPCAFVAIGDNAKRKEYAQMLREKYFLLPSIISPDAVISPKAKIGDGTVVMPHGNVGAAEVGDFCIIASNGLVNAEAKIEDYVQIDSGSIVLKGAVIPELKWLKPGEIGGTV